ncbi:nitrite/sulfite reductase [Arcobacter porcinus]|uniref:nitrite/sulfite reductase n=1 Tax=Arcobacter porcinus TaxID=1935204 RepID=UPI00081E97AE|nr:nitrite/sulfite reductase [Arcobacter porcinus]OCL84476.1 Sulfite reductase ferredoxin [Arcobacter porcinus]
MAELSALEQLKASRNPLRVIDDIYKEALEGIPLSDEYIGLLKWYGMYPHVNKDNLEDKKYFMKRIKIVDAKMNLEQLNIIAQIGVKFAQNYIDFTTRQNVQYHFIQIKDMPEIFKLLNSVNLTSRMASGDGPRPIMTCPVSGIAEDEIIDVKEILKDVDSYFDKHDDEFCNFPRKYKMGISGCSHHCANHEIQDLAFTAFKNSEGEVLFDLSLGGGLSKSQQIARRLNKYVTKEQVRDVAVVVAKIFREHGNRESRNKARIRHLLNDWGAEKFVNEIEKALGYKLQNGDIEPKITPSEKRNHFGVHKQKQKGLYYIGFATNAGRIEAISLVKIYEVCKKYEVGGLALTATQNFVIYDVKEDIVEEFAKKIEDLGFPYKNSTLRARLQSCTGREFCKFGVTETKEYVRNIVDILEDKIKDFDEEITIAFAGCTNGCSQPQISDIGLVGCMIRDENKNRVEAYEILFGGNLQGSSSSLSKKIGVKVPATKVVDYIVGLVEDYKTKDEFDTFKEYLFSYIPLEEESEFES